MEFKKMLQPGKIKNIFLLLALNMVLACSFAQVNITGKVTANSGNQAVGVAGISVLVKGTKYGGSTDNTGAYNISAPIKPGNYFVEFSGVGYQTAEMRLTVTSTTNYTLDVLLTEKVSSMDEVIVTGTSAGTTRRQLGSYISTVKADDLTQGATGNVLAALQGKTAGAQIIQNSGDPAGGISVRLRGISTIYSSSDPLYIIDGVIVNNGTNRVTNTQSGYDGTNFVGAIGQNRLVDINPQDIDRIEVLNGAAAAAIYGSRANAGVVQIFTKKGKTGAAKFSFSTSILSSSLRKKLEVNQAPTKFGGPTDGTGALTQDIIAAPLATNTTNVTRYDYQDYIFRDALGTDNTMSVSGGTDKTKYYVSGSYFYNEGIVKNTSFQRYSFRTNIDQVINKWASFNIGLNYVNSSANEKPDGNSFYSPMNSITIIGNFHNIWQRDANGNIQAVGERGRANPVSVIEDIKQKQSTNRVIANLGLKINPFKHLTVDYSMGIDNYSQNGTTLIPPFAYNVSTAFWGGGFPIDPTQNGYASTANNTFFAINHDLNATYNFDITQNLNSVTQVGFSQQYEKNNFSLLQGRGLAPFVQTVNAASTILPGVDDRSEISISGLFLQQNFKYRNQLFLTGAIRQDGSSVFSEDQRKQVYLKGSASYVLSGATFWENLGLANWWELAKVRVAYGQSGNLTGIGAYSRFNSYTSSPFVGRTSFNSSSTLANENVKPERQEELEFGVDLGFFNNRLGFTLNVYNKKVNDLLINRFIAPSSGFSSLLDNLGSLENKGFEIVLSGKPVQSKNLQWEITGIYNHNRNKAIDIGQSLILLSTNSGAPVSIIQGQPIGIFYGTFFARDANGGLLKTAGGIPQTELGTQGNQGEGPVVGYTPGRDPNGQPTGSTLRKIIGDPNPDFTASLVNEVTLNRFGLRLQIDAVKGVDVFNADFRTRQGVGNGKVAEQEHRGELPRGYITGIYAVEEWRVDEGDFVKVRELSLSYNFGSIKSISNVSVIFSGRNLVSWDNYKGYDPEVNAGGQSTILRGIDFGAVPIPKTFSLGIKAQF
jgi:TonB-linked SusC/RagA family outer membrane protein